MTFDEFVRDFDYPGAIVLLEGKRNVREEDCPKLTQLGEMLASQTHHMEFRSGNALGSDFYFSLGVAQVDKKRLQVITPYAGHRKNTNLAGTTLSLESIDLQAQPELIAQSKRNLNMSKLVDKYVEGHRDAFAMKAAYIIRDTAKVLGAGVAKPTSLGIFYDDLDQPKTGGTGHTMIVCEGSNVPVIDQRVWFQWLLS